jgi:hypothetical protein
MKANRVNQTVSVSPKHKKIVLALAFAWAAPLVLSSAFAQDKPPTVAVAPEQVQKSTQVTQEVIRHLAQLDTAF